MELELLYTIPAAANDTPATSLAAQGGYSFAHAPGYASSDMYVFTVGGAPALFRSGTLTTNYIHFAPAPAIANVIARFGVVWVPGTSYYTDEHNYLLRAADAVFTCYRINMPPSGSWQVWRHIASSSGTSIATGTIATPLRATGYHQFRIYNTVLEADGVTPCVRIDYVSSSGTSIKLVEDTAANRIQTAGRFGLYFSNTSGRGHGLTSIAAAELTAATAVTSSGPSSGNVGEPSTPFTLGANGFLATPTVVTLGDGDAGGTWTPATVTLYQDSTATAVYTPASGGTKTLTAAAAGLSAATPIAYEAIALDPLATSIDGPTSGDAGVAATLTLTLNRPSPVDEVYTLSATGGGTLSAATLTIPLGATASPAVVLQQDGVGTTTVSAVKVSGLAPAPAPLDYVTDPVTPMVAMLGTGYILDRHPHDLRARPIGYPVGTTITYRWERFATPIAEASAAIYAPSMADHNCCVRAVATWSGVTVMSEELRCIYIANNLGTGTHPDGSPMLPRHPDDPRYYLDPARPDDSGDGLTAATAKKTWAGVRALTDPLTSSWHILVKEGARFDDGYGTTGYVRARSLDYPCVIQTYDPSDPTNEAKMGKGQFWMGDNGTPNGGAGYYGPLGSPHGNIYSNAYLAVIGYRCEPQTAEPKIKAVGAQAASLTELLMYRFHFRDVGAVHTLDQDKACRQVYRAGVIHNLGTPDEAHMNIGFFAGVNNDAATLPRHLTSVIQDCLVDKCGLDVYERNFYINTGGLNNVQTLRMDRVISTRSADSTFQARCGGVVDRLIDWGSPFGPSVGQGELARLPTAGVLGHLRNIITASALPRSGHGYGDIVYGNLQEGSSIGPVVVGRGAVAQTQTVQFAPNVKVERPSYLALRNVTNTNGGVYRPAESGGFPLFDVRTDTDCIYAGRINYATSSFGPPTGSNIDVAGVALADGDATADEVAVGLGYVDALDLLGDYKARWAGEHLTLFDGLEAAWLARFVPTSPAADGLWNGDGTIKGAVTPSGEWNRPGYIVDEATGRPTDQRARGGAAANDNRGLWLGLALGL